MVARSAADLSAGRPVVSERAGAILILFGKRHAGAVGRDRPDAGISKADFVHEAAVFVAQPEGLATVVERARVWAKRSGNERGRAGYHQMSAAGDDRAIREGEIHAACYFPVGKVNVDAHLIVELDEFSSLSGIGGMIHDLIEHDHRVDRWRRG